MAFRRWSARLALVPLLLFLATGVASAEEDADADPERALQIGHAALALFEAGDFQAAFSEFERAEALAHSPVFVLYMARSRQKLGHWLEAKALLSRVASENADAGPGVWRRAIADAAQELEALNERLPSLVISARGPWGAPLTLSHAGTRLPVPKSGTTLELNPGAYSLVLSDANGARVERRIELVEGQKRVTLVFELEPRVESVPQRLPEKDPPSAWQSELRPMPDTRPHTVAGVTALGLGAGALLFGGAMGVVALLNANEVKENCIGNSCRREDAGKAQSARRFANLATVGFVVGAVGVGTGLTLILWKPAASDAAAHVGFPTGVALGGAF